MINTFLIANSLLYDKKYSFYRSETEDIVDSYSHALGPK